VVAWAKEPKAKAAATATVMQAGDVKGANPVVLRFMAVFLVSGVWEVVNVVQKRAVWADLRLLLRCD
jgi:hypothetical protein